jgi:hypothetical protein
VPKSARKKPKRPGRARIAIERVVLGALMSTVVFFAERRLKKALKVGPEPEPEPELFSKSVRIG